MERRIPHLQSVYYIISPSIENLCGIYRARSGGRYKCAYQLPTSSSSSPLPQPQFWSSQPPAHYRPRVSPADTRPLYSRGENLVWKLTPGQRFLQSVADLPEIRTNRKRAETIARQSRRVFAWRQPYNVLLIQYKSISHSTMTITL